jgi:hypothetical protein
MDPNDIIQIVTEIGKMLEPGAKAAWEIAARQVHVNAVQLIWGAIAGGITTLVSVVMMISGAFDEYDDVWGLWSLPLLIGLGALIPCALGAYGRAANPDFYIISVLAQFIP